MDGYEMENPTRLLTTVWVFWVAGKLHLRLLPMPGAWLPNLPMCFGMTMWDFSYESAGKALAENPACVVISRMRSSATWPATVAVAFGNETSTSVMLASASSEDRSFAAHPLHVIPVIEYRCPVMAVAGPKRFKNCLTSWNANLMISAAKMMAAAVCHHAGV